MNLVNYRKQLTLKNISKALASWIHLNFLLWMNTLDTVFMQVYWKNQNRHTKMTLKASTISCLKNLKVFLRSLRTLILG